MRSQLKKYPHVPHSTAHAFFGPHLGPQGSQEFGNTKDEDRSTLSQLQSIVAEAVTIVSMHPDEVTEAVIDFALAQQVPFAVLPCCVFHRLFPERKNRDTGESVREYYQLLDYLQQKDPRIQREVLPFSGSHARRRKQKAKKEEGETIEDGLQGPPNPNPASQSLLVPDDITSTTCIDKLIHTNADTKFTTDTDSTPHDQRNIVLYCLFED